MDEKEFNNIYAIPANYTDSGKLFGGMLEPRNAIETGLLLFLIGYPELMWLSVPVTFKIIIMTVTLLPTGVLAIMGIGGDSLLQYISHMIRFWFRRRKLHYRRIGYPYANNKVIKKKAAKKKRPAKGATKKARTP